MSVAVLGLAAVHFAVPIVAAALSSSRALTWCLGLLNLLAAVALGAAAYSALDFTAAAFGLWVALSGLSKRRANAAHGPGHLTPTSTPLSTSPSVPQPAPAPARAPAASPSPARATTITPLIPLTPARPLPGMPHVSVRGLPTASADALARAETAVIVSTTSAPSSPSLVMGTLSVLAMGALLVSLWKGSSPSAPATGPAPAISTSAATGAPTSAATSTSTNATAATPALGVPPAPAPADLVSRAAVPAVPKARPASAAQAARPARAPSTVSPAGAFTPPGASTSPATRRQLERCLRLADDAAVQRCLESTP